MDIRIVEHRDLEVVCALRIEFMAEFGGVDPGTVPDRFAEATRQFVARSHANGTMTSWLAEEDGSAAGLVSVVVQDVPPRLSDTRTIEGLVVNMYVRRSWRLRGFGRRLMRTCLDAAGEMGLRRLNLYATPDGRPLYADIGFITRDNWMVLDVPSESSPQRDG